MKLKREKCNINQLAKKLEFIIIGLHTQVGAIAQLVERLDGIQKVGGSIPPGSTTYFIADTRFFDYLS